MKFSVLLSVYIKENPQYLKEALNSIVNQSLEPSEIIIIKDGPLTNELEKVIDEFSSILSNNIFINVFQFEKNMGLGRALAKGVEISKHEVIARMDTDDIAHYNRFERQYEYLKNNPDVDLVGSWIEEFDEDNIKKLKKVPIEHEEIMNYSKFRNPICHMVVMFRKSSVLANGNYEHYMYLEDYYLWVKMLTKKCKFYNIPDVLMSVRVGKDMYKRRGGLKYFFTEVSFQKDILALGHINFLQFIRNIVICFLFRIQPQSIRGVIYQKLLRNNH